MTNTILTPEEMFSVLAQWEGHVDEQQFRAIEAATLAALVQRAPVEAVAAIELKDDVVVGQHVYATSNLPDGRHDLYPPEAIAQREAQILALRGETDELRKELSEVGERHVRFVLGAHSVVCGERDQLRAQLEAAQGQEPVATVESWTNGSYWRNYKLDWHKDVPAGTKLYLAPAATPKPEAQAGELLEFVQKVAKQKPEKPDYWSACGQCERNISDAEDLVDALHPTQPKGEQA